MKSILKIILIGIFAQFIVHSHASARGEVLPPPPFFGGNAGDWLGSGPIFGFEGGNGGTGPGGLRNPWNGGGGSNGGWGGSWWNGNGPLGGGGWGGWGGWGSGQGPGSIDWGGNGGPGDTTKKGYLWPDANPKGRSCIEMSETGGLHACECLFMLQSGTPSGTRVPGECVKLSRKGYDLRYCETQGQNCEGIAP